MCLIACVGDVWTGRNVRNDSATIQEAAQLVACNKVRAIRSVASSVVRRKTLSTNVTWLIATQNIEPDGLRQATGAEIGHSAPTVIVLPVCARSILAL